MTRVLVIDDSGTMRKIQKNVLTTLGVTEVVEAENGQEAILRMKEHQFDFKLVLCDWNMPIMDGITFLQKIRSVPQLKALPVVMVTTEGEKSKVVEAIQAGANGYIVKPFTPDSLKARLTEYLGTT
ncbi:MAG: response regulator [Planctomycetes bacterium]|nr:response regulator [Planctomycetota bacterium]